MTSFARSIPRRRADDLPGVLVAVETPRILTRPSVWLGGIFLILLVGLPTTPWQQSASASGSVVAFAPADREQQLEAPITGKIVKWHVVEGQHVAAGELIVELEDIDPNYMFRLERKREAVQSRVVATNEQSASYDAQVAALTEAQRVTVRAAELQIEMASQKLRAVEQKLEAEQASLTTAEQNAERTHQLFESGLSSKRDLELAELTAAKARAAVNQARAAVTEAKANVLAKRSELLQKGAEAEAKIASARAARQNANSDEAKAQEELAKIESSLARQASQAVRAPRSGTILRVIGSEGGKTVKIGEQLGILVPDTESRAVQLYVDGNDAPLITPGRLVRLQFEGWPAVQFVGWPSVAVGTFPGKVAMVDALGRENGKFRVLVVPDPNGEEQWPEGRFLRQGVKAKGWVLLNQVSLGYEVWRKLNGFPVSLTEPPNLDTTSEGAK